MTAEAKAIEDAGAAFARDASTHQMTVLRDDGLYRHLRFLRMMEQEDGTRKPTSFYWFDIITWPGVLTVTGDMETFVFARVDDMFEFFRGHKPNPGYWAEKLRAPQPAQVKRYSEDKFKEHVTDYVDESVDEWPGLREAVEEQILGSDEIYYEHNARVLLDEFEFGGTEVASCTCGATRDCPTADDVWAWKTSHRVMAPGGSGTHLVTSKHVYGFQFSDTWEWDLAEYTHQFLWCCHAIPWAIAQFDSAKATAAKTPAAVSA